MFGCTSEISPHSLLCWKLPPPREDVATYRFPWALPCYPQPLDGTSNRYCRRASRRGFTLLTYLISTLAGMEKATLWLVLQKVVNNFKVVESYLLDPPLPACSKYPAGVTPQMPLMDQHLPVQLLQEEVKTSGPLGSVQKSEDRWESITP